MKRAEYFRCHGAGGGQQQVTVTIKAFKENAVKVGDVSTDMTLGFLDGRFSYAHIDFRSGDFELRSFHLTVRAATFNN